MDEIHTYRYCPRCGKDLELMDSHLQCNSCGLSVYTNPRPCTSLLLRDDEGKYLLVERAVEPKKGWWDLPGGFVEKNETFEAGARREALEELGVQLSNLEYFSSYHDIYEFQGVVYPTLAVCFTAEIEKAMELKSGDDVASYKFFALEDVPLDRLAFGSMHKTFETLISNGV